jgi:dTDP-4-amino-4,6-dideoxy-D-galactose acyltransferase
MKKLIILSSKKTKYSKIFFRIKKLQLKNVKFIYENELDLKIVKKFDIIVFENLKKNFLRKINELKIISININKYKNYNQMIDISIDPFFKITKKNSINPIMGSFRPIQLDINNDEEFKYLLNVISIMDWDTNFWKKKVSFIGPKRLTNNIIYRINKFIKINKIEMVQFLSYCHDAQTVKIAEKNNFGFKDIRVTLEKKIDTISKKIINKKNISFRKATLKDFQNIKPIAKNSYLDSRYYFDSLFPLEKVKNFYIGWLKKAILGTFDTFCLLICYKKKPIGFCTIKIVSSEASIGLFSISQNYQKQGFSKILLSAVNYEVSKLNIDRISVVTQGRNYSALKAYQGSNFKISKTELWYHKWISSNK